MKDSAVEQGCVKCGHGRNDPRRRDADKFDSFCIPGCGCACSFSEAAAEVTTPLADKMTTSSNEAKTPLATDRVSKDIQLDVAPSFFEARIRNQAENLVHDVFGYPATAAIHLHDYSALVERIATALLTAHASTQDGASASAQTRNVTDKGSVQHESELIRMLRLRKELYPDAPDAIVLPESESSKLAEIESIEVNDLSGR